MSNKNAMFFFMIILSIQFALAEDLELKSISEPDDLCPGSTGLFTDLIKNNLNTPIQVTVSSSGTAASFVTTVPQGFTLNPGKTKTIYSYTSPRSSTPQGDYTLTISAESGELSKTLVHNFNIKDCYDYSLKVIDEEKIVCPGQQTRFDFELRNLGNFMNSYILDLEGEYSTKAMLSDSAVSLNPGELKVINVNVNTDENDVGNKQFTLVSKPNIGSYIRSASANVLIDECYDFELQSNQNLITTCDRNLVTIPITIKNSGTAQNTYSLQAVGPAWANPEINTITIPAGQSGNVNLILSPDYGVEGNYQVSLKAISDKGKDTVSNNFNVQVNKCYDVNLLIQQDSDNICNALEKDYEVVIRNNGKNKQEFTIDLRGPTWSSISDNSITLDPSEERKLTLRINPDRTVLAGSYEIEITSTLKESNKITSSDKITINAISENECFQVSLNAEDKNIDVSYDTTGTIPVLIKNNGLKAANYNIAITGTATDFVYLNPSSLQLSPGESEILYMYIAPSSNIINGVYTATISASTEDNSILSTETVNIDVKDSKVSQAKEQNFFRKVGNAISGFFTKLFKPSPRTQENITLNLTNATLNETVTIIPNITSEETEEEEENEEEQENISINNTNILNRSTSEIVSGAFTFDNIKNQIANYKNELIWILVILVIILIIIRFDLHKKFFKLFEEEIEEEKPSEPQQETLIKEKPEEKKTIIEEKKEHKKIEEPVKEKKDLKKDKKDKKKKPTKEEEEDDEVVIEFDDED